MKSQIDGLMQERGLAALLVVGGEGYSEVRDYMSNGAHITGGIIVKKVGDEPLLVVNGMETEEAKKSGYTVKSYGDLDFYTLQKETKNRDIAQVLFWGKCLQAGGVAAGKVGLYGRGDVNEIIELTKLAVERLPQYEFVGETERTLFDIAFLTKDDDELARIRSVAERTNDVMAIAWDFIAGHTTDADETLIKEDGTPLTIGDIKRLVRRELLERELEDTGMIFAQGRDAGFPHSRGEAAMPLKLGQSIVFDLFPRELGGGYHHDMTRTWSIGYATPEVQQAYDDVMEAFDIAVETFGLDKPTHLMQEAVQDNFEAKGHPTMRTAAGSQEGYVHSLGHGIGLLIHERPSISHTRKEDLFQKGNVITIEPGLYYPDKGYGVRVEDSFVITDAGELVSITPFRKDLVLPLK